MVMKMVGVEVTGGELSPRFRAIYEDVSEESTQSSDTAARLAVEGVSNDKGRHNDWPSRVVTRPPPPAPLSPSNDNLRQVADATKRNGFVYLGSPYSLYADGYDEAARVVSTAAAQLMVSGVVVYSPIAHGHFVCRHGALPQTWKFWKAQCQPMIDAAESMIVLTMDGWRDSVGLTYEIAEFERTGRLVVYMSPAEIARQAQQRARSAT